ncbi:MAG: TnsA endonuclease N-terminal domain-containing protein [Acidithiobacillus sp.]|jgi:hypothetical protein|uniref:TnsA endonuclease N-terminal domain-containing protein n=1 Tax=Acidithiobacillus sp. TaxID=1872118 RepID=UPI0035600B1E
MVKSNKFSLGDIRKHFNISLRKINELIKKYNIKINKKSYAIELSKLNINDIINLYCEQNLSTRDVSKKLNIHRCYVSSILKTHNLMRTQKEGKVLKHYKKEQNTKFKRGYYFSVKCNKQFYYRSSYEEKFLKILDNDNRVLRYNVEPIIISSKNFYTIPDVLVELENEKILVEIKSNYGLTVKNTIDKLNVMKLYAENNNMKFIILTQDQLNSCNDWMCNNINVSLLKTNGTIQNASTDVFSG